MGAERIIAALGDALNSSPRPPALAGLARPRYPERELAPQELPDGTLSVRVAKWGWEYKHRGPRPAKPYPSDPAAVLTALAPFMPEGVTVQCVDDCGTYIRLFLEVAT